MADFLILVPASSANAERTNELTIHEKRVAAREQHHTRVCSVDPYSGCDGCVSFARSPDGIRITAEV